jgi:hypothetical protein
MSWIACMNTWEQNGGRSALDDERENEGDEREGGDVA